MKNYILFAAAALMLGACSNDENLDNLNGPVELRLTSGLEVQTRATHNLDTQLKNGEKVHVWVDDAITDENLYADNTLTADGSGNFTDGETMYFPSTGNHVDIYAIHGNFGASGLTDFWNAEQTHSVVQGQRSSSNGYAQSDLVYTKSTDVARNGNPTTIKLNFQHLLSKIEVVLVQGEGKPTIEKVEILNTKLEAKFTPSKTETFPVTASGESNQSNPIEIDTDLTSKTAAENKNSDEGKVLNEAIIVPQTLVSDTPFIRVTTAEGGVLIYRLKKETTFASAKKYRYTITANLTGLEVTASISNWTPETGDDNGVAEME